MSGELAYVDSSAIVKLIKEEEETEAISAALTEWPELVSADLLDVEVTRVGRGLGLEREAERVIGAVSLIPMSASIRRRAGRIGQAELRTLDAIHVATAEALGDRPWCGLRIRRSSDRRSASRGAICGLPARCPIAEPGLALAGDLRAKGSGHQLETGLTVS